MKTGSSLPKTESQSTQSPLIGCWFCAEYGSSKVVGKCVGITRKGDYLLRFRWGNPYRTVQLVDKNCVRCRTDDPRWLPRIARIFQQTDRADRPGASKRTAHMKALILGLSTVVILPLSAELWFRIQRHLQDRVAERYRSARPTLYDQHRWVAEAYGGSLWLEYGVRYRPGASLTVMVGGVPHTASINSLGYRDREFTVKKPPGIVRIACIGGSTTVQGVSNEQTYPALMEKLLRARFGTRIQVLNLGVSGSHSDYWLKRPGQLAELLRFEPDIVVQYQAVNDICHGYLPAFDARHPVRAWLRRSLLFDRCFPIKPERMDRLFGITFENMRQMHEVLRANGILHVIGTFARPDALRASAEQRAYLELNMAFWSMHSARRRYDEYCALLDHFNLRLIEAARSQGWTLAPVHERLSDPTRFVDICHNSPEGIADLAKAFLPEVAEGVESVLRARGVSARD